MWSKLLLYSLIGTFLLTKRMAIFDNIIEGEGRARETREIREKTKIKKILACFACFAGI